jgi:hypothetical protein
MGVFTRRKPAPSPQTEARLERARREYEEQKRKHAEAKKTKQSLQEALAENHIAELMFEALSAKRGSKE